MSNTCEQYLCLALGLNCPSFSLFLKFVILWTKSGSQVTGSWQTHVFAPSFPLDGPSVPDPLWGEGGQKKLLDSGRLSPHDTTQPGGHQEQTDWDRALSMFVWIMDTFILTLLQWVHMYLGDEMNCWSEIGEKINFWSKMWARTNVWREGRKNECLWCKIGEKANVWTRYREKTNL